MHLIWSALVAMVVFSGTLPAAETVSNDASSARLEPDRPLRLYDLRVYQASPGKLAAVQARLRDHQIPLLQTHGVFTQAVFVPVGENPEQRVMLLTAAEGVQAMDEGWAHLGQDPRWLDVVAATDGDGEIVASHDGQRLVATSWSPALAAETPPTPRVFELRTYSCPDATKHAALLRRFEDHTMAIFARHGMRNIIYWVPDERPESQQRLVYILAHDSVDAARESFAAFRKDPDWLAAKDASEKAAGGALTNKQGGVVSEFLVGTEFSPLQ